MKRTEVPLKPSRSSTRGSRHVLTRTKRSPTRSRSMLPGLVREARLRGRGLLADEDITGGDDSAEVDAAVLVLSNRPKLMAALALLKKGSILVVRWRSDVSRSVYFRNRTPTAGQ